MTRLQKGEAGQVYLSDFYSIQPTWTRTQDEALDWLAWIHSESSTDAPSEALARRLLARFSGRGDRIGFRSHEFPLYGTRSTEASNLFVTERGFPLSKRMEFYQETCEKRMHEFYGDSGPQTAPDLLIHVSCTGYVSPSAAQKIVLKKNWGQTTRILHHYHMGCCAAFPAVRSAQSHLAFRPGDRVDVVHNELCTLHLNPHDHSPEQLVVQSLFADGHIRYSASQTKPQGPAFEVLAVCEELVADSAEAMTWAVHERGFQMTLARDVPERISAHLKGFLQKLEREAAVQLDPRETIYAIHPGGPRLIDLLQDHLQLEPWQVEASLKVLHQRGNMSSATIPHVWQRLLETDSSRPVVSLAFGPGLTILGSIMRRVN